MEKYANEKNIVKNDIYELFKDNIYCQVCNSLMIDPVICLSCQSTFCKKCSKELKDTGENCPKKCSNFNIQDVIGKNNLISKFKFKCINGCGEEILYDNINNHYKNCKPNKIKKIKVLSKEQAEEFQKKNNEGIGHLKCN